MTLQNSIGNGVISKSEDGFADYRGKIPGDFKEGERVSIIRTADLDILQRAGVMHSVKEPINNEEAKFPSRVQIKDEDEYDQMYLFDGNFYYMENSVWVRYHPVKPLD